MWGDVCNRSDTPDIFDYSCQREECYFSGCFMQRFISLAKGDKSLSNVWVTTTKLTGRYKRKKCKECKMHKKETCHLMLSLKDKFSQNI